MTKPRVCQHETGLRKFTGNLYDILTDEQKQELEESLRDMARLRATALSCKCPKYCPMHTVIGGQR